MKKAIIWVGSLLLLLLAAVTIHVYLVTRPKAPDEHTRILARIDFRRQLDAGDSAALTTWLYGREGVEHVLCNPGGRLVVFSYFAKRTNADRVLRDLNAAFPYRGTRYLPSAAETEMGCPVISGSFSSKAYLFFKHLF